MVFGQLLGAALFVTVGENLLDNQLLQRLPRISGFDPRLVMSGGATSGLSSVSPSFHYTIPIAYNEALRKVFQVGLIVSSLTVLGPLTLEWRSISKSEPKAAKPDAEKGAAA
ncbi:hypothetical protein DL768_003654 [Monosporascus sp. mg162]|nr:hypothetical protein DL768_003654 [Monosporascus sp. mg162]